MLSRKIHSQSANASASQKETTGANVPPRCKEFSERRRVLEQARSLHVRRIQQEVQRIAQRELEYAQRIISEYTPVKLSVNESAWSRWQEFLPIRLDFIGNDEITSDNPSPVASSSSPVTPATPNQSFEDSQTEAPIA